MTLRYRRLVALGLMFLAALCTSLARAQPALPLLDATWSANCDSAQDFVLRYLRNNTPGANYAVTQFQGRRETMKASGFARYDAGTGTWTLVDNFVTSSRRAGSRENVLRMAPGGGSYTVISSRIDGQPLVSNGVEVRTGQPMPPRHRCGPDSAAARAIPSWEEIRAQPDRLAFPQPPGSPQAPSAGPAEQAPAQAAQRPSAAGGRESAERSERGGKPAVVEALAVNDIIAEPGRYLGRTVAVACDTVWRSSSGKSITCDSSRGTEIDVDAGSLDRASFRYVLDRCGNNDQCSACAIGQVARSGNSLVLRNVRLHMMIFGFCSTEMPLGG